MHYYLFNITLIIITGHIIVNKKILVNHGKLISHRTNIEKLTIFNNKLVKLKTLLANRLTI